MISISDQKYSKPIWTRWTWPGGHQKIEAGHCGDGFDKEGISTAARQMVGASTQSILRVPRAKTMKMWRRAIIALMAAALLAGCGGADGSDRPEDCSEVQYFDEGSSQCRSCPAVAEPECMTGCGVEVIEDNRSCPVLRCDPG